MNTVDNCMKNRPAILLDVEGTIVPISCVYDTLFPYSREHMRTYLNQNSHDPEVKDTILKLHAEHIEDKEQGAPEVGRDSEEEWAAEYCFWLMDHDRKSAPLKAIQGRIWERGFDRGELQGEIFSDVFDCLRGWHKNGTRIAIYSSGSILAQRLVLGHTPFGDLVPWIEAFFDTSVGPKRNAGSYQQIARELHLKSADILFASDAAEELDAASSAGMDVVLSVRPGNAPVPAGCQYRRVHSLREV